MAESIATFIAGIYRIMIHDQSGRSAQRDKHPIEALGLANVEGNG